MCGKGSGGLECFCMTGPEGMMTSREAMLPLRAKSGCLKSLNHSMTSFGSVSVKNRPTCPWSSYTCILVNSSMVLISIAYLRDLVKARLLFFIHS